MKKWLAAIMLAMAFVMGGLSTSNALAAHLTLNQISESSARITSSYFIGSGTCVWSDKKWYYVITNAHVIKHKKKDEFDNVVSLEFFSHGKKSKKVYGEVTWKRFINETDVDFAIIRVSRSHFDKKQPRVIPLAPATYSLKEYTYIAAAGFPKGRWLQAWEGYTVNNANHFALFTPAPISGQSGTGVCVNIDGNTYVGGIISWSIGQPGKYTNGYDRARGAAIPISTLIELVKDKNFTPHGIPSNYYNTAQPRSVLKEMVDVPSKPPMTTTQRNKQALKIIDGMRAEAADIRRDLEEVQNRQPEPPRSAINKSKGKGRVLRLNYSTDGSKAVSQPTNYTNGFGFSKYGGGYSNYQQENNSRKILEQMRLVEGKISELQAQQATDTETIAAQKIALKLLNAEKAGLQVQLQNVSSKLSISDVEKVELKKDATELKDERNMGFGLFGSSLLFGVLYTVGRFWYTRRGRTKVKAVVDKVQDRVEDTVTSVAGENIGDIVRKALEGVESRIGDKVTLVMGEHKAQVQIDVENKISSVIPPGLLDKMFDLAKKVNTNKSDAEDKTEDPTPQPAIPTEVHPSIRQWGELKRKEGETLEHWAYLGVLYKKAVDELRKGNLYYKDTNRLQGQKVTSEKIDTWVKTKYIDGMTLDKMEFSNLWHEAYLGYLYKQAVQALKDGEFAVLGAEATATAINNWVHTKLVERTTGNPL